MASVGRSDSGNLGFASTGMFWIQNHMVAPQKQALGCAHCHVPGGRIDFAVLGYPAARAATLQTLPGFEIARVGRAPGGNGLRLDWRGTAGHLYQVQVSTDLRAWSNAPAGDRRTGDTDQALDWTQDDPSNSAPARFFRIVRTRVD